MAAAAAVAGNLIMETGCTAACRPQRAGVYVPAQGQASKQLAWGSQQPWVCLQQQQLAWRPQQQLDCPLCSQQIPEEQPLTPDYESVYVAGYKAATMRRAETGSKATTRERSTRSR